MSLSRKLEIEPLNDARWSRIEKSLFDKMDREGEVDMATPMPEEVRPRRAWKGITFGALALAAAVLLVVIGVRMWPGASVVASNPSRIVTGSSDSHLALGESSIDVGPESALLVSGDDARGLLVVVDRGKVTCEVAPRAGRPAFVVQAGDVRVRVVGTRFTVVRTGDAVKVDVAHGVVEVSAHGTTTMVRAGEVWPAGTTASIAAPTSDPIAQAPVAMAPTPTVSADDPATSPNNTKPANGSKRAPAATAPTSRPSAPVTDDPFPAPTTEPPPAPPSPRQLYEQAAQLERSDPSRALGIYRQLAAAGGAWGMNALFAQGRLEADRGNRGEARRLLNEYLSRYPRGPNAADARALLDRLK